MRKIKIEDLDHGLIEGVDVHLPDADETYCENYFEWTATSLTAKMATSLISGGVLRAWHHTPVFYEMETHADTEMFYFVSGVALMLFIDVLDGRPAMETAQIVRIKAGTQISISPGKGHFVAVAENSEPICAVVVAPKMDAPRMTLPEPVTGVSDLD